MIMEPLLGGKLAGKNLPKEAADCFKAANPDISPAAWAFRWLYNQPEVTVVLSGMNEQEQLDENIKIAENAEVNMLTPEELDTFRNVKIFSTIPIKYIVQAATIVCHVRMA